MTMTSRVVEDRIMAVMAVSTENLFCGTYHYYPIVLNEYHYYCIVFNEYHYYPIVFNEYHYYPIVFNEYQYYSACPGVLTERRQ